MSKPNEVSSTTQSTLKSYFGKPAQSVIPRVPTKPAPSTSSSPPSSSLRTPSSNAASSPHLAKRAGSPLKLSTLPAGESDEELTPPPNNEKETSNRGIPNSSASARQAVQRRLAGQTPVREMAEPMNIDSSPEVTRRRTKRKPVYVESDESSGSDVDISDVKSKASGRKPRKSLKADSGSDDDFVMNEDDFALAAAADAYEASLVGTVASPSPSVAAPSPPPRPKPKSKPKPFVEPKAVARKPSAPSRPAPQPLPSVGNTGSHSQSHSNSDLFLLTKAERSKLAAKEEKAANEECYDFLADPKDKEGNRPSDPGYDKRTIFIPKSAWNSFTPFEKQFWQIKQNCYDTVLFFQKGKFYELYEDDAAIGHQEFDLKLTDRVKMKMVGVPEQQFDLWSAKFLAAGYKVGKVVQTETALGNQMRTQGKPGKEIVHRELQQIFTTGTIVDGGYLNSDDANHCVSIKEYCEDPAMPSTFGLCVVDASTGEFKLSHFQDDVCRTRLETMFRQIRPKELLYAKDNLSVPTSRLLRNILPATTVWQSFRDGKEFPSAPETLERLSEFFPTDGPEIPAEILSLAEEPVAMEALGGMMFYLKTLNLDKDLLSQRNFNVYDPIREGQNLVLDGQTLGHMEVLVNNEGGDEGTLLKLLQRCQTPFGKRLFRIWLTMPLKNVAAINDRLDAVEELIQHHSFCGTFTDQFKGLPDLERLVSRIHAGSIRQTDFLAVVKAYNDAEKNLNTLSNHAQSMSPTSVVGGLLNSAPDLQSYVAHINALFHVNRDGKSIEILPKPGADVDCDNAQTEILSLEAEFESVLRDVKGKLRCDVNYWSSNLGTKDIYQIQVPTRTAVPKNWEKVSENKSVARYIIPETRRLIREMQEAKETKSTADRNFYKHLLSEFDKDRAVWLSAIKVIAEIDCLVSLAKASADLEEPKCRPEFIESSQAFVDFEELRHPSMCLRSDFIANDVQLGGEQPRTVLLTGPNMAGKSTLLRMTAAAVILAQMGCYVPAARARLSPIDKIQTRMGAYDNMFASASTFKVELDECSKILREAGPRSLVILDELGRGTSTFDGMAIAGAVLHHIATHTLPLGFFATHYGSLTDDFVYHPNIRNMHMQTRVDEEQREVVFLYKLVPGIAKSSYGTHVASLAGVPKSVVDRADSVSAEFFEAFKDKLTTRRRSALPLVAQADVKWLLMLAFGLVGDESPAKTMEQFNVVREIVERY
ncbi:DNA mismatch repair protein MSH6, partial [Tremellales sp. Uapishka_1]